MAGPGHQEAASEAPQHAQPEAVHGQTQMAGMVVVILTHPYMVTTRSVVMATQDGQDAAILV